MFSLLMCTRMSTIDMVSIFLLLGLRTFWGANIWVSRSGKKKMVGIKFETANFSQSDDLKLHLHQKNGKRDFLFLKGILEVSRMVCDQSFETLLALQPSFWRFMHTYWVISSPVFLLVFVSV